MNRSVLVFAAAVLLLGARPAAALGDPEPWTFSGIRSYEPEDLVEVAPELFRTFRRTGDETAASDAAWEIARFYLEEGYPYSHVEAEFVKEGVVFLVHEGPRVLLGEVTIDGTPFAETLAEFVDPPRTWFLGSQLYVEDALESAARNMRAWLRQRGYLDAEVAAPPRLERGRFGDAYPEEATLPARFTATMGPKYLVESVALTGVDDVLDEIMEELAGFLHVRYSPFTPYDVQGRVVEFFANRGHPWAKVMVADRRHPDGDVVRVTVEVSVDRGPPARVGRIGISGNRQVIDEAIRRELLIAPGDDYDGFDVFRSQQRVFGTGLFGQVNADLLDETPPPLADDGYAYADMRFRVEEIDFRRFETSVGFGSWELARGSIGMEWLNLDGFGRSAAARVRASMRGYNISGQVTEPWLFEVDNLDGTVRGFYEEQERPTFLYDRLSLSAILTKQVAYKLVGSLTWSLSSTEVFEVTGDVPEEFENTTNISSLTVGLVREARDNPWDPTWGSHLSASVEVASPLIGSEISFIRTRFRAIQVLPVMEFLPWLTSEPRFLVAGIAEFGTIAPYGDDDEIPIQERFFLGGGQTVRSFEEDDLGPRLFEDDGMGGLRETGSPSGGEFFSRMGVEVRFPILGDFEGAVFFDAGNVIRDVSDAGLSDYRYGVGAGLRYRTPLGPIRIDFAVNPSRHDDESSWEIAFAIGYPF